MAELGPQSAFQIPDRVGNRVFRLEQVIIIFLVDQVAEKAGSHVSRQFGPILDFLLIDIVRPGNQGLIDPLLIELEGTGTRLILRRGPQAFPQAQVTQVAVDLVFVGRVEVVLHVADPLDLAFLALGPGDGEPIIPQGDHPQVPFDRGAIISDHQHLGRLAQGETDEDMRFQLDRIPGVGMDL